MTTTLLIYGLMTVIPGLLLLLMAILARCLYFRITQDRMESIFGQISKKL